jgi:hypothetical protein
VIQKGDVWRAARDTKIPLIFPASLVSLLGGFLGPPVRLSDELEGENLLGFTVFHHEYLGADGVLVLKAHVLLEPGFGVAGVRNEVVDLGAVLLYDPADVDLAVAPDLMKRQLVAARVPVLAATTGAGVIATANPGCMLQLRTGAERYGTGQRVVHVVELLDEAYRKAEGEKVLEGRLS